MLDLIMSARNDAALATQDDGPVRELAKGRPPPRLVERLAKRLLQAHLAPGLYRAVEPRKAGLTADDNRTRTVSDRFATYPLAQVGVGACRHADALDAAPSATESLTKTLPLIHTLSRSSKPAFLSPDPGTIAKKVPGSAP